MATMGLFFGMAIAIVNMVLMASIPHVSSIGLLSLFICAPFMLLSIIVLITKIHETRGVDLNTVTGAEWD